VLDAILEDYVEESRSADEIASLHNFDLDLVRRVIRMIERSEYKRQQAAPGIKISAKAFGYGRRFPIAAKSETLANCGAPGVPARPKPDHRAAKSERHTPSHGNGQLQRFFVTIEHGRTIAKL